MAKELTGRTALVTGGGAGIGAACARRLAAGGARVLVADKSGEAAGKVAAEVGGVAVTADLSDPGFVELLPGEPVDIVVNNAGFQHVAPIEEFPPAVFAAIVQVMVQAPFLIARRVLPGMYERGWGRFVNVSSVHGLRASPYKSAYVTAKHALEGFSKALALEGAPHGVTSTCVCPAYVRTALVESQIADQAEVHGISREQVVEDVMLQPAAIKRLIEPDEVAEMVAYLCGPAGSFITGVSIPIDGGWTAH
ncbi:SDR family NAD(P)-dependent oxidoreductase [Nonomuraea rhizosphaerae]|uniref:SDR family NAD(P)-dependent oxidoreductase n=1 Tax=Nonomuraea rhizosphaerae TaxID=2665663 RepID=UPI001C5E5EEE|nr:SDR family NAD(P)-dependent oxidoreductase [Nonomuraea rhizosphaerae]